MDGETGRHAGKVCTMQASYSHIHPSSAGRTHTYLLLEKAVSDAVFGIGVWMGWIGLD